ncbi:hypothetical protein CEXT_562151 [Caerostris extrusa]|uniref:Uncharacterized protein n=1 Tax=Caerostris extrusa TaxID=172846 RepID=A0AAV4TK30_CAEEX|nr:hypothetical protein CEXT_562151 [Caerostris extrusa]
MPCYRSQRRGHFGLWLTDKLKEWIPGLSIKGPLMQRVGQRPFLSVVSTAVCDFLENNSWITEFSPTYSYLSILVFEKALVCSRVVGRRRRRSDCKVREKKGFLCSKNFANYFPFSPF